MRISVDATVYAVDLAKRPPEAWGSDIKQEIDRAIESLLMAGVHNVRLVSVNHSDYTANVTFSFAGEK